MRLSVQPPAVWPEPRVVDGIREYEHQPPIAELAMAAESIFGTVCVLTGRGVSLLDEWLHRNPTLRIRLILVVYPTCETRQAVLGRLLAATHQSSGRLRVHVRPLGHIPDRATTAVCLLPPETGPAHIATGAFEDLGLADAPGPNLLFRADAQLLEAFKRHFDLSWARSIPITAKGVAAIPDLVIPEGTIEAARLWQNYLHICTDGRFFDDEPQIVARVDPDSGDVTLEGEDGGPMVPPTEEIGLAKLDPLAQCIARIYDKGALVSVDKLSRIPPLDAPLDPSLFGDRAEEQTGSVTRKVSMRVSVIDEKVLKEIEKRRQGLRTLLSKFTFALADNVRWMPTAARPLFERELARINDEGVKLIGAALQGKVDDFVDSKRDALLRDVNTLLAQLGRPGRGIEVIDRVMASLKERLDKAKAAKFVPELTYTSIVFSVEKGAHHSPWGQASSLLIDIAAFPRKMMSDTFFARGFETPVSELVGAMNVADDSICRNGGVNASMFRCKKELELLSAIEKAHMEPRTRCECAWRIISGESHGRIEEALKKAPS